MNAAVPGAVIHLRLFVAGGAARSRRALETLDRICNTQLKGLADFAVVDIYQQPELAEAYQVVAVPTLLRLSPPPVRRVVGDLADPAQVLRGLDIA